jgi:hypothetical protein
MRFFLGTHQVDWLRKVTFPLFVSRRRLVRLKSWPRAAGPWALDSGGFTELSMYGRWTVRPSQYAAEVRRFREDIGNLLWAAPQDWMCEPHITARTGLTVAQHQDNTTVNLLELRHLAPDLPFIPVLQGQTVGDYLRHVDGYARAGVDLTAEPVVGVGSVCRRQGTAEAGQIARDLSALGLRVHMFGAKTLGLRLYGDVIASSDSLAWSRAARFRPPMAGCPHVTCANCLKFASLWRSQLLNDTPHARREMNLAI